MKKLKSTSSVLSLSSLLVGAFALLGTGCFNGSTVSGYPCLDNDQCGKGQLCERGFCGGPPVPNVAWGPCTVEGCLANEFCGAFGDAFLSCAPTCNNDTECVGFVWDAWQFGCVQSTDVTTPTGAAGRCLPLCDINLRCPDGRDCVNVGGKLACAWWQSSM